MNGLYTSIKPPVFMVISFHKFMRKIAEKMYKINPNVSKADTKATFLSRPSNFGLITKNKTGIAPIAIKFRIKIVLSAMFFLVFCVIILYYGDLV